MKNTKTILRALLIFIGMLSMNAQAGVEITYMHNDALGSAVAGTDAQGNVKWRSHYQPYGTEMLGQRVAAGTRAGFTGHRDDSDSGLTYMGARYYSPAMGRFMGIDPAGVSEGNLHNFNRYAYANNNPYKFVDPDGREVVPVQLLGLSSSNPVLKTRTYYVDKKIASDVKAFVGTATKKYPGLSVNNTFRLKTSSTIQTTNTKAKGLSRHQAGFAIDLNGTGNLTSSELAGLRTIAGNNNLGPAINPNADKPHFSADPTKFGYSSLKDAVTQNRKSYNQKRKNNTSGGTNAAP